MVDSRVEFRRFSERDRNDRMLCMHEDSTMRDGVATTPANTKERTMVVSHTMI